MATVLTFFTRKGGVGKTTSCVNIGADLAMQGRKVLLIDADSQCHTTFILYGNDEEFYPDGNYDAKQVADIKDVIEKTVSAEDAIRTYTFRGHKPSERKSAEYSMDIIPGSKKLAETAISSLQATKEALAGIRIHYDYIVIDCPPGWDTMTATMLAASDYILVPIQSNDQLSLDGYGKTLDHISEMVNSGENSSLEVLGVFLTKTKPYRKAHRSFISDIESISSEIRLFKTGILESEQPVINSIESHKPLCEVSHNSHAAKTYYELAQEIDSRIWNGT